MTEYEVLMIKSDAACKMAIKMAKKGDWRMAAFYKNASEGFKNKARNLK